MSNMYWYIYLKFSQAAFLSALAGTEVAEAAARAAVTTLTEVEYGGSKGSLEFVSRVTKHLGMISFSKILHWCTDVK